MKFEVKTRNAKGRIDYLSIEADDRSALFAELSKRGVTAISVSVLSGEVKPAKAPRTASTGASQLKGFIALVLVLLIGVGACLFVMRKKPAPAPAPVEPPATVEPVEEEAPVVTSRPKSEGERVKAVKAELEPIVREFIRKADTNNVIRLGPAPLDPDDPDNALRTRTMTEVQMLIGIEPGEPMPPIPFAFMMEDAELESAMLEGKPESEVTPSNGNSTFCEELEKWKITIKDTDSLERAERKKLLLDIQLDLLKGINEGVSVNDAIRSAWEFRKKAYEMRCELISSLKQMDEADPNPETALEMLKFANEKLAEEGIKPIHPEEAYPDYEFEEVEEEVSE